MTFSDEKKAFDFACFHGMMNAQKEKNLIQFFDPHKVNSTYHLSIQLTMMYVSNLIFYTIP